MAWGVSFPGCGSCVGVGPHVSEARDRMQEEQYITQYYSVSLAVAESWSAVSMHDP